MVFLHMAMFVMMMIMSMIQNCKPLSNFPNAAIRFEISNNAAVHLATGLLIDYGVVIVHYLIEPI